MSLVGQWRIHLEKVAALGTFCERRGYFVEEVPPSGLCCVDMTATACNTVAVVSHDKGASEVLPSLFCLTRDPHACNGPTPPLFLANRRSIPASFPPGIPTHLVHHTRKNFRTGIYLLSIDCRLTFFYQDISKQSWVFINIYKSMVDCLKWAECEMKRKSVSA